MKFRRDGKTSLQDRKRWTSWLTVHAKLVKAAGLPSDVVLSEEKFSYFLQHTYNQDGYLARAPWFSLDLMTNDQRRALWQLIQAAKTTLWVSRTGYSLDDLARTFWPRE